MRQLSPILEHKNNNFTLIRLIAAVLVVYGHAFELFPTNGYTDVFSGLSHFTNSGSFGVYAFFFLSGMFVTGSFDRLNNPMSFSVRRVLRLVPALFVCVTITVFIIGPIVTQVPLKSYFSSSVTWGYELYNITVFKIMHQLPGVFLKNHWPNDVNGSLHTLALEIKCYVMILVLGFLRVFKKKSYTLLAYALIFATYFTHYPIIQEFLTRREFILFVLGSMAYVFRDKIMINYKILIVLIVITIIVTRTVHVYHLFEYPFWLTVMYLVIIFSSSSVAKKIKLPGDYSYGIYIYGFLVQQILANYFPATTSYQSFFIVMPIVLLLAIASWHLIEKRAIDLGHHLFKTRTKIPARV